MCVQGLVIHTPQRALPKHVIRHLRNNFGGVGEGKAVLKKVHSVAGVIAYAVSCGTIYLGMERMGRDALGVSAASIGVCTAAFVIASRLSGVTSEKRESP